LAAEHRTALPVQELLTEQRRTPERPHPEEPRKCQSRRTAKS
jgi:hypothetical protein